MSRNYTNSLLFESALDTIGPSNPLLFETANDLFRPRVKIVEEDCSTLLGQSIYNSFRAVGLTETETGTPLTEARLQTLVAAGVAYVNVRSLDTCISKGGVCRVCLRSSRPDIVVPAVGFSYNVQPQIILDNSRLIAIVNQGSVELAYDPSQFDKIYVYANGVLMNPSLYLVNGKELIFAVRFLVDTIIIVKYLVYSNIQYYYWVADTYSGSLLGIKSIQNLGLPIRKLLLETLINKYNIETLTDRLNSSNLISQEDFVTYIPQIKDPVESAVFVILLNSVFLS